MDAKDDNILKWTGTIKPLMPPYDEGAFKIELIFPTEYPFKPPILTFKTKIYHPNIDEKGQVCLPIINAANWKPATKTEQGQSKNYGFFIVLKRNAHGHFRGVQKGSHLFVCAALK